MANDGHLIEAAGGLLWRPAADGGGAEVAIVHRPHYDDYSVPKGKLDSGEHVLLAAVREVREETGFDGVVGRPLGAIAYKKDGSPKRVRFWAMRVAGGSFAPNDEVDRLLWLSPVEALAVLSADRDPSVVERFAEDTTPTVPLVIVRHASAGDPGAWTGEDRERPLDGRGADQSARLAALLPLYGVTAVMSADVLRCTQTVQPFAESAGLAIQAEPLLSDDGFAQNAVAARQRVLEIAGSGIATVVCSQGTVIPDVVLALCEEYGYPAPADPSLRKGNAWVAHLAIEGHRMVALEALTPLS